MAQRRCRTATSWGSFPSSTSPIIRSSTRVAGSGPPTAQSLPRSNSPGGRVPFGIDLLFACEGRQSVPVVVGIEICEDLWMPIPPSSVQAGAGATILLNLSASNETIGKSQYRTDLVVGQSGRCIAAYAYAGAGPSESTTDLVFGGHCLIAENGRLLTESPRVGDGRTIRRDTVLDHPGRGRRQAPVGPPDLDELRARAAVLPTVPASALRARPGDAWPEAIRAGHALRAAGRARAAPPLRRDLRYSVRGAGQADRAASPGHSAEYRHLGRTRLHSLPARRRQDVRPARHLDRALDSRADDARLRHHRQRPGTTHST